MRAVGSWGALKPEGTGHEVVPEDDEHHNDGNSHTWMQATAVGVCLAEVTGELTAIGFDIGSVLWCLAISDLFLSLGFGNQAVELVLALGSVDVDTAKAAGIAGG